MFSEEKFNALMRELKGDEKNEKNDSKQAQSKSLKENY